MYQLLIDQSKHGGSNDDDKENMSSSAGPNWDPGTWNGFTERMVDLAAAECPLEATLKVKINTATVEKVLRREFIV